MRYLSSVVVVDAVTILKIVYTLYTVKKKDKPGKYPPADRSSTVDWVGWWGGRSTGMDTGPGAGVRWHRVLYVPGGTSG